MTRRLPSAARAARMRSWISSGGAAVTSSGSATWTMTDLPTPILSAVIIKFPAMRHWVIPEGLRVLADGSWRVGEHQVLHPPTLRYLKSHLTAEDGHFFVADGAQRMPIQVE